MHNITAPVLLHLVTVSASTCQYATMGHNALDAAAIQADNIDSCVRPVSTLGQKKSLLSTRTTLCIMTGYLTRGFDSQMNT